MTIYQRRGMLYLNFMFDGKRKQKSLKLEDNKKNREVVRKEILPQLQKKIALGEYNKPEQTFGYYAKFFIEQKQGLRGYKDRRYCYNKVIKFFENKKIHEITRFEVKQYIFSLKMKNISKSVYIGTIREILDLAIDDGIITHNVAANIKHTTRDTDSENKYLEKEEVVNLLNNAKEPMRTYLDIGFSTGMRPEEILALKFTDIKDGFCKIQRAKTDGEIHTTKTQASKRTVPFSVDLSYLERKSCYLFPNINDVSYFRRQWLNLLKKCSIEQRGIYNTRHTFATHLLKENIVSAPELSGLLGHTKVSTTLKHYASVIDSHSIEIENKLKSLCYKSVTVTKFQVL